MLPMQNEQRTVINLVKEPRDEVYRDLLDFALHDCSIGILVVRPDIELNPVGLHAVKLFEPFLNDKRTEKQWPGTLLTDGTAEVLSYVYSRELCSLLQKQVNGLYEWAQPGAPEDLCLLRPDGSPWLVSISHEKDGYLELNQDERERLLAKVPELFSHLKESGHSGTG